MPTPMLSPITDRPFSGVRRAGPSAVPRASMMASAPNSRRPRIVLALAVVLLSACSTAPASSPRRAAADHSWTARAAAARGELERPRGMLEAWEAKRPTEFGPSD